jgi:transcription factor E
VQVFTTSTTRKKANAPKKRFKTNARAKPRKAAGKQAGKRMKTSEKKARRITHRPVPKHTVKEVKEAKEVKRMEKRGVAGEGGSEGGPRERRKTPTAAYIYNSDEVKAAIDQLQSNDTATNYLKKNISKRALDVINALATPKTDEALAEELGLKINAVRRILNIMQGYGITNYYIAKNVNGWLSFAWYVNVDKIPPFFEQIESMESTRPAIREDCNDYFVCDKCYDQTKLVFTFESAFEDNFKCGVCGTGLRMLDKSQASELIGAEQRKQEMENKAVAEE